MITPEKLTPNMEFTVHYEDGTTKQVREGVLFEFDGNKVIVHVGTNSVAQIFSVAPALSGLIADTGLGDPFKAFLDMCAQEDDCGEEI